METMYWDRHERIAEGSMVAMSMKVTCWPAHGPTVMGSVSSKLPECSAAYTSGMGTGQASAQAFPGFRSCVKCQSKYMMYCVPVH